MILAKDYGRRFLPLFPFWPSKLLYRTMEQTQHDDLAHQFYLRHLKDQKWPVWMFLDNPQLH